MFVNKMHCATPSKIAALTAENCGNKSKNRMTITPFTSAVVTFINGTNLRPNVEHGCVHKSSLSFIFSPHSALQIKMVNNKKLRKS